MLPMPYNVGQAALPQQLQQQQQQPIATRREQEDGAMKLFDADNAVLNKYSAIPGKVCQTLGANSAAQVGYTSFLGGLVAGIGATMLITWVLGMTWRSVFSTAVDAYNDPGQIADAVATAMTKKKQQKRQQQRRKKKKK